MRVVRLRAPASEDRRVAGFTPDPLPYKGDPPSLGVRE